MSDIQQQGKFARIITTTLLSVQGLVSAATITSATIAAIVGQDLSGNTNFAGIPGSVSQLGAAFSALVWSFVFERLGRRAGLTFGLSVGAGGAALAAFSVMRGSFPLLLLGLAIMASAKASTDLSRFIAAEVNPPERRGRAVATVVLGGTLGSVVGPLLVDSSSSSARSMGIEVLVGPYAVGSLLLVLAAIVAFLYLRPDPAKLAAELAERYPSEKRDKANARSRKVLFRQPLIIAAIAAMILGYAIMVMMMGITSLHMRQHAHSLRAISIVFSVHTLGMFAFSVFTGQLIDRWGRQKVIISGAVMLLASCLLAPISTHFWPIAVALFLLGLGWNFCYVGGSTLLSDQLSSAEKAATQGTNDMFIGLTSAAISAMSGVLLYRIGYGGMGIIGAILSALLLVIMFSLGKSPSSPKLALASD